VSRFNGAGTGLVYSTYFGGTEVAVTERGTAIAIDPAGNVVVVGATDATNFPTTAGSVQPTLPTLGTGGFVTRLSPTGDALLYSSYLHDTTPNGVAVDALGQAYVTGAAGTNMQTTSGVYQATFSGSQAAFVAALSADGATFNYSTFVGGSGMGTMAAGRGIAIDSNGNAYITGETMGFGSPSFPTTAGAFQTTYGGGSYDAFVSKLNATGTSLAFSSFFGGSGDDRALAIAVDGLDSLYFTGYTTSSGLATTGAYKTTLTGSQDVFVAKVNAAGSSRVYTTYIGGSSTEQGNGIAVASDGSAVVAGVTNSANYTTPFVNFPSVNPLTGRDFTYASTDGFLTKVNAAGTSLVFSSSLSGSATGSANTAGYAVALDRDDAAYVTGTVNSGSFGTSSGAYQATFGGGSSDAFVLKATDNLAAPLITAISNDTGSSSTDFITSDQTLSISGTAPNSVTVRLFLDTVAIGTTTSNGSGAWTFSYTGTTLAEGTYAFTAQSESGGTVSKLSPTQPVTVALTAPDVELTVPATETTLSPVVQVRASNLTGMPSSATATLDVDLNNDGDFLDTGETGFTTGTLANNVGSIPVNLSGTGTYNVQARVTDLAGNQWTSAGGTIVLGSVGAPWAVTTSAVRTSELADGNPLLQLGDMQLVHPLDLDKSPGSGQSGNPVLIYNSSLVGVRPIIQAQLQADNSGTLPSTITVTLTWNGTAQMPIYFSTIGFHPGDKLTVAVQSTATVTTTGS
jgi:hypothetical protein